MKQVFETIALALQMSICGAYVTRAGICWAHVLLDFDLEPKQPVSEAAKLESASMI